jgi:hypothetical protein
MPCTAHSGAGALAATLVVCLGLLLTTGAVASVGSNGTNKSTPGSNSTKGIAPTTTGGTAALTSSIGAVIS